MGHTLPISQAVDENGVEGDQDELSNKDACSEALNSLTLFECKGTPDRDSNAIVARQSNPSRALLQT